MSTSGKPNILLIIADDLGADVVLVTDRSPERKMYVMTDAGGPMDLGELPILSTLLRCGLYFEQAWAQPACSPTRASIYTGTWPWRNGVGYPSSPQLDPEQVKALPVLLGSEGYQCGLFGKWHLGLDPGYRPPDHGWNRHVGTLDGVINPKPEPMNNPCGLVDANYENWCKQDSDDYANPTPMVGPEFYATRVTVEEAGSWIAGLLTDTPWFATIAFHTPHGPFHVPPYGYQLPRGAIPTTDDEKFNAMVQNMDANIGRLLGTGAGPAMSSIAPDQLENTVIIFIGDNGSPENIATEEPKTTIYEGGVRVPLIVADGQAVAARINGTPAVPCFLAANKLNQTSSHLVHAADLYETITEIAGVTAALPEAMDSVSLWRFPTRSGPQSPTRNFNFSQYFIGNNWGVTIRNLNYKLNYERKPPDENHPDGTTTWSLYGYRDGEVPGNEGIEDGDAVNMYPAALDDVRSMHGPTTEAGINLNDLLDELTRTGNYAINSAGTAWEDPRSG